MKKILRVISYIFTFGLIVYFVLQLLSLLNNPQLEVKDLLNKQLLPAILSASILYALIVPISAWAWKTLLKAHSEDHTFTSLFTLLASVQLAKYIPGNIAHHIGRFALSTKQGISTKAIVITVSTESILAVIASLTLGSYLAFIKLDAILQVLPFTKPSMMVAILVIMSLICMAILTIWAIRSPNRYHKTREIVFLYFDQPLLKPYLAYCINYALIGAGVWLIYTSISSNDNLNYALCTSAFALSWLAGFLTIGAPAGIGTREALFLMLLNDYAPDSTLVILALCVRLSTMLGDLLIFFTGLIASAVSKKP
ncbi:lysylphosphatidylglycerol synthase domain-containing protein [Reinekea blandensis]|uniref:Uncharacterized protein n=1 Tax=Reinekea blandensis MED297 TaxID=314283 RepID=A4BKE9_9GAMM|nr:lysylphosphatidylglycerol synthase domain-containing protein [Reinekea blandensis]EAR07396.1 hypothetical protein MED297_03447 [Reinekea sp. MED297] [Reinekea blandensis MED297]